MKSSKKEFIAEAEDLLEEAARLVLEIQDTYNTGLNPDTINALFRAIHTLKGLSGLFGHQGITDLSHAYESFLDEMRLGKVDLSDETVAFLFRNIDILKNLIDGLTEDKEPDVSGYIKEVKSFHGASKGKEEGVSIKDLIDESILRVLSEYEEFRLKTNIKEGKGIYITKAVFKLADFDTSLNELTKTIKSLGELISTLPVSTDIPADSIGFNLMFGSPKPVDALRETISSFTIDEIVPPAETKTQKTEHPQEKTKMPDASLKSITTNVRVDIGKLDRILNTIGELTLVKGAVKRIGSEMVETYGHSPLIVDVYKISQALERRVTELQDQVLQIRMVPIGQIFSRLGQIVRRYSREVGKQINLAMYGEDTEIDKYLAEEIIDPMMHLVRNAIDHGIEHEGERLKSGKPKVGTVTLKAFQRGNHVVIEVSDDGAGIDIAKVRKKAIEKGLLTEGAAVEDKEIIGFIFAPGFSTKDIVSEVSGRGVGMDVVKEKLSLLGGFADVETELGKGSTFTVTLPITLAIIKALLGRVGQERFAIPLTSISETLVINESELQTVEGKEIFNLRGDMLPMTRLSHTFRIESDAADKFFAVVVGFAQRKIGLIVDELLGQHEVVIKPLGDYFKGIKGFAGAAEIGKHEVILVIDIESIIGESLSKQKGGLHV